MSMYSLIPSFQSVKNYVVRNRGRIALFTVTAGAAIAAVTYIRRLEATIAQQTGFLSVSDDSAHNERVQGSQRLRRTYQSNVLAIRRAFRALLPNLRTLVSNVEAVQSGRALARLRERPSDFAEKQALWEQVKHASLTHVMTAISVTALLYSFLCLQLNLLARYSLSDDSLHAPVQALPAGLLSSSTSKRYLDLVLRVVLNPFRISHIVSSIHNAVRVSTANLDITQTPSIDELSALLHSILDLAWNPNTQNENNENTAQSSNTSPRALFTQPKVSSEIQEEENDGLCQHLRQWLLEDLAHDARLSGVSFHDQSINTNNEVDICAGDRNFSWLVRDTLDLCDVLDFNGVVCNNTKVVLSFVLHRLRQDVERTSNNSNSKAPTFARLFARFTSLAGTVLSCREINMEEEGEPGNASLDDIDRWLAGDSFTNHFGACVFLSGERDPAPSGDMC